MSESTEPRAPEGESGDGRDPLTPASPRTATRGAGAPGGTADPTTNSGANGFVGSDLPVVNGDDPSFTRSGAGESGTTNGSDGEGSGGVVRGLLAMVRELVLVVVIALGLSLLIKTFFVQAFFIPSESMENTLLKGDRILVTKLTPGPFELKRGDVVVFKDPGGWLDRQAPPNDGPARAAARKVLTFVGLLPSDSGQHLIKRVVGLPGDRVVCCDANGAMTVNGIAVDEPYLRPGSIASERKFDVEVPEGRLWVMGDNRQQSRDSRFNMDNHQGTVPVENVVGRSFVVVWPFPRMEWMDRPSDVFAGVPDR